VRTFDADHETERERVLVDVSEYVVATAGETLVAYGLGASVAIALWDPTVEVGALTHTLLPRQPAGERGSDGKYVDAAVPAAIREMIEAGAGYADVEARIAGGADIFELADLASGVGRRNAEVAREEVRALDVPVVGEAVGGDRGRTVVFDTATGEVTVETAEGDDKSL
jgi:chemotaxis protein CheD